MKSFLLALFTLTLITLQTSSAQAHVLISDQTKGKAIILHVTPDDDPIAGQPAMFFFDMQNQTLSADGTVRLTVRDASGTRQTVQVESDGSLTTAEYIFPARGVYTLIYQVGLGENAYIFEYTQRVSRGTVGGVLDEPAPAWADALLLFSVIGLAVLIIVAWNRRAAIKLNSKW